MREKKKKSLAKKNFTIVSNKNSLKKLSKKPHKKFNKNLIIGFVIILISALLVLSLTLLVQTGIIENPLKNLNLKEQLFMVKDGCSMIVGNLMHTINNDDDCKRQCKSDCQVREMNFQRFVFTKVPNNCNECSCYCK